jgi:hypothetical protein
MSGLRAQELGVDANAWSDVARAEKDGEDVGDGKGEQEAAEAWCDIDFEAEPAHAEMGFPVPEGQLDVHPLAVEVDDIVCGQLVLGAGGDQEEPRLLEVVVVEDDDIDRFLRGVLIGGVGVAAGLAATIGKGGRG